MIEKNSVGRIAFNIFNYGFMIALSIVCIIPIWHVLMASLSDPRALMNVSGILLKPIGEATLNGYRLVMKNSSIITGYINTIIYVGCAAVLGTLFTTLAGFVLSRKTKLQKAMTILVLFTMMFSGGLIPSFMVNLKLGIVNTRWAIIIPGMINAYYIIIMKSSFEQLPSSYEESAKLDGAGPLTIMVRERGCKKFERRSLSNIELMSAEADKGFKYGKSVMEKHLRLSAYKLLLNLFRLNLFEQPYVDIEESLTTVGCMDYVKAGYEAQLKSVVLLKNKNQILPAAPKQKVYIPNRHISEHYGFVRFKEGAKDIQPVSEELLGRYFECVEIPEEADLAIVFADSPIGDNGFEPEDTGNGESGYRPISLQYRPYTAVHARKESIAGGDPREAGMNRSYYGKQAITANESDLDNVIHTKERMKDKPVIVCIRMKNPAVMAELEPFADVILVEFGVQKKALLDIITGVREPCGKLPMCLPKNMETVERHMEDVATDIEAYTDTEGHTYDLGYGITKCGGV